MPAKKHAPMAMTKAMMRHEKGESPLVKRREASGKMKEPKGK